MSAIDSQHRFLALGDSYTIGEGVAESSRWPMQLSAHLRERAIGLSDVDIVATTGWTTDELQQAINARNFAPPYALVSLLIGVNNQYRGREPENFRTELSILLDFAVEMAGGDAQRVLLISIPDWSVTRFAAEQGVNTAKVAEAIDRFNGVAQQLSQARGTHWIDVTGLSRGAGRELLVADGLHPSAEHYALWLESILPIAESILQAP